MGFSDHLRRVKDKFPVRIEINVKTRSKEEAERRANLPKKDEPMPSGPEAAAMLLEMSRTESMPARAMKAAASLGVIRLDYDYPPAPGDIDCPDSFQYHVYYRVVPGLTFEMCQSGVLTDEVRDKFIEAVRYLDTVKNVSAITGDCGFMMWFQRLARQHTRKPVLMSSLVQLASVTAAYSPSEKIAIFTANGETLAPMNPLIEEEFGVDPQCKRFKIVGCQDVPGFEAVAVGGKVDVEKVTPGILELAQKTLKQHPEIRALLLECTELPPYSDALRHATGLPVYDAITCCNMFIEGLMDNPRFGIMDWQHQWDGMQESYKLGEVLDAADRENCENC